MRPKTTKNVGARSACPKCKRAPLCTAPKKLDKKLFGIIFMKHDFAERLRIVQLIKSGIPIMQVSREFGVHRNYLFDWVRKYDYYGAKGLETRPRIKASSSLKASLVCQFLEKGVPLYQLIVESGVGRSSLERWIRLVRQHGYHILYPR